MAILDAFWKRQKRLRGEVPDVYVYDTLPEALRVQIVQIMMDMLGDNEAYNDHYGVGPSVQRAYETVVKALRRELGVFQLPHKQRRYDDHPIEELAEFILNEPDVEKVLGSVEFVCRLGQNMGSMPEYRRIQDAAARIAESIDELNQRFKEHGVGYLFDGDIVRIDSEFMHSEAVKPALLLLRDARYSGADEEFRNAHAHYRSGKYKECLTDALKSLESVMKVICGKRKWQVAPTDTAKRLIEICLANDLIPAFWQGHFSSLRAMLESSVPTARNKTSGHGQGTIPTQVPPYLAAYVMHMTASTIVFLVEAEKSLP